MTIQTEEIKGFKNCYYDPMRSTIYLREQGDPKYKTYKFENWCYVQANVETDIKDLHGRYMKRIPFKKKEELAIFKKAGLAIAESDFRPEVKFLHERYDKINITPDIDDWHICEFDIEVASGSEYYDNHIIKYKPVRDQNNDYIEEVTLFEFDQKYNHAAYLVLDEKDNTWKKYEDSCYITYDFPDANKALWPINLVSFKDRNTKVMHTFSTLKYEGKNISKNLYHYYDNELDMVKGMLVWFNKQNFDILTGWNSVGYDIPYIVNRCRNLRKIHNLPEDVARFQWERALSPLARMPEEKKLFDRLLPDVDLGSTYTIPGLFTPDYMDLYDKFGNHPPLASLSLNYVSNLELGKGKLEYEGKISETYKKDPSRFGEYNREDVDLIDEIEDKKQIFPLVIAYCYDTVTTLDKIFNKVPTSEGYILKDIHNENLVMNDRVEHHEDWWRNEKCYEIKMPDGSTYYQNTEWEEDSQGYKDFQKFLVKKRFLEGESEESIRQDVVKLWRKQKDLNEWQVFMNDMVDFKKNPHPFEEFAVKAGYCYDFCGRYDDDISFDITSSYPHHIMQFYISPEGVVRHPTKEQIESGEVILTDVNEVGFRKNENAIIPKIVKKVFAERKHFKDLKAQAKKDGDTINYLRYDNIQNIKKNIINSMYGVCLTKSFHLYNVDCARAICRCARVTLRDWLSKDLNNYYVSDQFIQDCETKFGIEFKDKSPIKLTNRPYCAIHNDTDSVYFSVNEIKNRMIAEGYKIGTEEEYRSWFDGIEDIFQTMFNKTLQRRAAASRTENKIKFNRENEFLNMFCFAKKLYIGRIFDSEGDKYPLDKPKHKIMGVGIKRSDMPDFCKEAAEELAFAICKGMKKEDAEQFIYDTYSKYKSAGPDAISSKKSISNYKKYVPHETQWYIDNGLRFEKGMSMGAKCALAYNYIIQKNRFKLSPINNNTKFNYLWIKPNNDYRVESIAYLGKWPEELDKILEIDYELMFRKSFIPIFDTMFTISKWKDEKDEIQLEKSGMFEFFC